MNAQMATAMTYGADVAGMLASLVALATLCLSLRRPAGKHRKVRRVFHKWGKSHSLIAAMQTVAS